MLMGIMNSFINLRLVFRDYPETRNNINTLDALLKDLYPTDFRERNLIILAYKIGIADQIKNSSEITAVDLQNYCKRFEENYGVSKLYANLAVKLWAEAYDLDCPIYSEKEVKNDNIQYVLPNTRMPFNEVIWENDEIKVIYKGFNVTLDYEKEDKISFLWGNLSITNKANKKMYFASVNMRINDDVICDSSAKSELQPYARNQLENTFWGDYRNLPLIGVFKVDDIMSFSFEMVYSFEDFFRAEEAPIKSNVVYVEPYYIFD